MFNSFLAARAKKLDAKMKKLARHSIEKLKTEAKIGMPHLQDSFILKRYVGAVLENNESPVEALLQELKSESSVLILPTL